MFAELSFVLYIVLLIFINILDAVSKSTILSTFRTFIDFIEEA